MKIKSDEVIDTYTSLIKPSQPISSFISELTGITNEMLKDTPNSEEVLSSFIESIGEDIVIGYNVYFDVNFIYDAGLEVLRDKNRMFVFENNSVEKIVATADLHKQPICMLIFSYISILEMQLTTVVKETYPNDSWTKFISKKRLNTAKEYHMDRIQKNEALTLLDNTQLCYKGTIIKNLST